MDKFYLSRAQTRSLSSMEPIGDPYGGAAYGEMRDPVTAIAGATVVSGLMGMEASESAADAQTQAARESSGTQLQMFNQNREDQLPWRQAGVNALGRLTSQIDTLNKPFSLENFQADPGYGFRVKEGQKALERSSAARGNLLSGGALKSAARFGQDYASNEYANAYNRYNQDNTNIFNRLATLSGIGQTSAQQIGNQGAAVTGQIGQNQLAAGNAQAAGLVGSTNALSGAVGQGMNFYNQQRLLDQFAQNRSSYPTFGRSTYSGSFDDPYANIG